MDFQDGRLPAGGFYLFSYPRSGSNWLFSALAYLFGGVRAEARIGPEIYPVTYGQVGPESFWIQAAVPWPGQGPLLIKSHESAETVRALYPQGKKIYLLRDGRDALISYYFFHRAFVENPGNKTASRVGRQGQDRTAVSGNDVRFDAGEYAAFLQNHARDWADHARAWLAEPDVCVVRYETLKKDFERELTRLTDFLGLPTVHTVAEAREEYVEHARSLLTGDNRSFHRKGVVGDWETYADERIRILLKSEIGETLLALGYVRDLDW